VNGLNGGDNVLIQYVSVCVVLGHC